MTLQLSGLWAVCQLISTNHFMLEFLCVYCQVYTGLLSPMTTDPFHGWILHNISNAIKVECSLIYRIRVTITVMSTVDGVWNKTQSS